MRALVIGGNRFLGVELTAQLLAAGHEVTLLNRGNLVDPFGARVQRLKADRSTDAFDAALSGTIWDAVIDFALFDGPQAARLLRVLEGRVGHLIAISTGQVYLVRTPRPVIGTEADYEGAVLGASPSPAEEPDWRYGVEKRDVEQALAASSMPFTTLRLPMVHGGRDPKRRIDSILWRLMDRGPILLTQPEAPVRQVFSGAVVRAVLASLAKGPTRRAFNLAWSEALTARTFVEQVARVFGGTPRIEVRSPEALSAAGIDPVLACTVNSRWMSALDATLARQELGFVHEPLDGWLPGVIHALVSQWTGEPPSMHQRAAELRQS
jgi:2'-hydroxyisoflavone reductase